MVNSYFNTLNNANDQNLLDQLLQEQIQQYGMDVLYAPASFVAKNALLGEDPSRAFTKGYYIEAYFGNIDSLAGPHYVQTHLGFENQSQATFLISINRFNAIVNSYGPFSEMLQNPNTNWIKPNSGDLIFLPLTGQIFEIDFADHTSVFYQIGKVYLWKLQCHIWDYAQEKVNTNYTELDSLANALLNDNSIQNDSQADNTNIETFTNEFVSTDPNNPFVG